MKCSEKKVFRNSKEAWSGAANTLIRYGVVTNAYKCRECKKFHLTTKRPLNNFPEKYFALVENYLGAPLLESDSLKFNVPPLL